MKRRTFLYGLSLGTLAAPLAAEAQQAAKIARIGFLSPNLAANPHLQEAFLEGLRDLGYVEGRNVVIEYRDAEGKAERLPGLESLPWRPRKRSRNSPSSSLLLAIR
jgi:putative ABC transport system substrate-binding protein